MNKRLFKTACCSWKVLTNFQTHFLSINGSIFLILVYFLLIFFLQHWSHFEWLDKNGNVHNFSELIKLHHFVSLSSPTHSNFNSHLMSTGFHLSFFMFDTFFRCENLWIYRTLKQQLFVMFIFILNLNYFCLEGN